MTEYYEINRGNPRSAPDRYDGRETPAEAASWSQTCEECGRKGHGMGDPPTMFTDEEVIYLCPDCHRWETILVKSDSEGIQLVDDGRYRAFDEIRQETVPISDIEEPPGVLREVQVKVKGSEFLAREPLPEMSYSEMPRDLQTKEFGEIVAFRDENKSRESFTDAIRGLIQNE